MYSIWFRKFGDPEWTLYTNVIGSLAVAEIFQGNLIYDGYEAIVKHGEEVVC